MNNFHEPQFDLLVFVPQNPNAQMMTAKSSESAVAGLAGAEEVRHQHPAGATGNLNSALSASMDSIAKQHIDSSYMDEDADFVAYETNNRERRNYDMEMDSRLVFGEIDDAIWIALFRNICNFLL